MFKNKSRGEDRAKEGGKPKKNLEEQAQDIMRSSDLKELDQAEIPEELHHRLDGANVAELDDLEEELGFNAKDLTLTPPEEPATQQTAEPADETEEQVKQVEESIDATCIVKVSDDNMSALISLYPSQHSGEPLDFAMVKAELESAGVVYGINEDLLKKLIITVDKTNEEKEGIIIAKGLPPQEGKDGLIEYHFGEDETVLDQGDEEEENE